tara:strand:+ start:293 stop:496 length:204 start_codon:yes stop_codon:yes gene_type:complete
MTFIFKKKLNGNNELKVEYALSSESNEIKVVQSSFNGEYHNVSWMTDETRVELMDELERDYLDRSSN